ncbi:NHL repeat-containing protein [Acrasis kona]|uniref:NHL repeat-containing protein n=1 Tax=Acrasis kona TaxID=1008807 RepID=A0AAW2Z300_9EUKA
MRLVWLFTALLCFLSNIGFVLNQTPTPVANVTLNNPITTVAGIYSQTTFSGDNGPATSASFTSLQGCTIDYIRNILYVCDDHRIRAINMNTNTITTLLGSTIGYAGDGGQLSNARLNATVGLAINPYLNLLYIADTGNHVIRVVDIGAGRIDLLAGTPHTRGYGGDGGSASTALLNAPSSLQLDVANNILYVSDYNNYVIRKIQINSRNISLLAGIPTVSGYNNDSGPATNITIKSINQLGFDMINNQLYFVDGSSYLLRKVDLNTNIVYRVGGNAGQAGDGNDGGPALSSYFRGPIGVAVFPQYSSVYHICWYQIQ